MFRNNYTTLDFIKKNFNTRSKTHGVQALLEPIQRHNHASATRHIWQ